MHCDEIQSNLPRACHKFQLTHQFRALEQTKCNCLAACPNESKHGFITSGHVVFLPLPDDTDVHVGSGGLDLPSALASAATA